MIQMENYIKSECYRAIHTKWVYGATVLLGGLAILFHVILWLFATFDPTFRYGTTSFSFSNLVAEPMAYCIGAFLIAAILYEGERRNGTRKNSISNGISRTALFLGKCLVSLAVSFAVLIPVMAAYIGSGLLLLPQSGPVTVPDLLLEIPAVSLVAASSLVLGILVLETFDRTATGILVWYLILFGIPKIVFLLSLKLEFLYPIALWMPANFFNNFSSPDMAVNMSQCSAIWDTVPGMAKCFAAGGIGILLFTICGIRILRKKDV